jgi:hypothetical protein
MRHEVQPCQRNRKRSRKPPVQLWPQSAVKKSKLKGASLQMYESMSEQQLEDFAETERKDLPEHVAEPNGD